MNALFAKLWRAGAELPPQPDDEDDARSCASGASDLTDVTAEQERLLAPTVASATTRTGSKVGRDKGALTIEEIRATPTRQQLDESKYNVVKLPSIVTPPAVRGVAASDYAQKRDRRREERWMPFDDIAGGLDNLRKVVMKRVRVFLKAHAAAYHRRTGWGLPPFGAEGRAWETVTLEYNDTDAGRATMNGARDAYEVVSKINRAWEQHLIPFAREDRECEIAALNMMRDGWEKLGEADSTTRHITAQCYLTVHFAKSLDELLAVLRPNAAAFAKERAAKLATPGEAPVGTKWPIPGMEDIQLGVIKMLWWSFCAFMDNDQYPGAAALPSRITEDVLRRPECGRTVLTTRAVHIQKAYNVTDVNTLSLFWSVLPILLKDAPFHTANPDHPVFGGTSKETDGTWTNEPPRSLDDVRQHLEAVPESELIEVGLMPKPRGSPALCFLMDVEDHALEWLRVLDAQVDAVKE